ncbi:9932_t:CDS:2 [Acaulospora morrowiae]|uniref:9932_t:CDS:1 n=1 Tax=Acaulospora morrowiae TaxID=94023 RepID=A0A9N9A1S1_9GLOM|nr:9932_t:CDS:2 [Acaulospora morrowiae]
MTTEITEEYVRAVIKNTQSIYSLRTPEDISLIMGIVDSLLYDSVWKEYNQESNHLEGWDYHHTDHEEHIQSDVERLPMIEESPFESEIHDMKRLPMIKESPFESETYDDLYEMDYWCDVCEKWVEDGECEQIVEFHKNGVYINECICDFVPVIDYFNSREELRRFFLVNNVQGLCIFCENNCSEKLCMCEFICGLKYVMGYDKYGKVMYGTCGWYFDNLKDVEHDCQEGVHRGFDCLNDVTMGADKRKDVLDSDSEFEFKRLKADKENSMELKPNPSGSKRKQPDSGDEESKPLGSKPNSRLSQKRIKNSDKLDVGMINRILLLGDDNMKKILDCEKSYQLSNLVDEIAFDIIKIESENWEEKMSVLQLYNKIRREIYSVIEKKISDRTPEVCTWLVTVCQGPARGMMYKDFKLQKWLSENSNQTSSSAMRTRVRDVILRSYDEYYHYDFHQYDSNLSHVEMWDTVYGYPYVHENDEDAVRITSQNYLEFEDSVDFYIHLALETDIFKKLDTREEDKGGEIYSKEDSMRLIFLRLQCRFADWASHEDDKQKDELLRLVNEKLDEICNYEVNDLIEYHKLLNQDHKEFNYLIEKMDGLIYDGVEFDIHLLISEWDKMTKLIDKFIKCLRCRKMYYGLREDLYSENEDF